MTTTYRVTDLAQAFEPLSLSLAADLQPFARWGSATGVLVTILALDASPTYAWRLTQDWQYQLAARASDLAGDVRTFGLPSVRCIADEWLLAAALAQILDPADLEGIGTVNTRAQEPIPATQVDRHGPANWFTPFDQEPTAHLAGPSQLCERGSAPKASQQ